MSDRNLTRENARLNAENAELRAEVNRLVRSSAALSRRVEESALRVLDLTTQLAARNAPPAPAKPERFNVGGRS